MDAAWVVAAFWTLSACRPTGMGVGHISFEAIDRYASRYGIHGTDEFDEFQRLIRAMDRAFVQHLNERRDD